MALKLTLLYDFTAHGGIGGTGDEWVCLVIKEVSTSLVVERVALVALDGATKVRSTPTLG